MSRRFGALKGRVRVNMRDKTPDDRQHIAILAAGKKKKNSSPYAQEFAENVRDPEENEISSCISVMANSGDKTAWIPTRGHRGAQGTWPAVCRLNQIHLGPMPRSPSIYEASRASIRQSSAHDCSSERGIAGRKWTRVYASSRIVTSSLPSTHVTDTLA